MKDCVNVLVSLQESCTEAEVESIVLQLQNSGLSVVDVMPMLGIVSGSIEREAIEHLTSIPGVVGVEEDQIFSAQ